MKFSGKFAEFLVVNTQATPAYVAVGQVQSIGDISVTAEEIDATTLDAGDYRDFLPGFKDPGECELTIVFDPNLAAHDDTADGIIGLFEAGDTRDCAIRFNSSAAGGETFGTFQAFIRDLTYGALNADDLQTITPLFRLRTPITLVDTLPTPTVGGTETEEAEEGEVAERPARVPARGVRPPARRPRARKAA
jgi:tail tube protein